MFCFYLFWIRKMPSMTYEGFEFCPDFFLNQVSKKWIKTYITVFLKKSCFEHMKCTHAMVNPKFSFNENNFTWKKCFHFAVCLTEEIRPLKNTLVFYDVSCFKDCDGKLILKERVGSPLQNKWIIFLYSKSVSLLQA